MVPPVMLIGRLVNAPMVISPLGVRTEMESFTSMGPLNVELSSTVKLSTVKSPAKVETENRRTAHKIIFLIIGLAPWFGIIVRNNMKI